MIDRTFEFWEAVKCVSQSEVKKAPHLIKRGIENPKTSFGKKSKALIADIRKLQNFLSENKKDYVGGPASEQKFTDQDRDKMESDCTKLIKIYAQSIADFKQTDYSSGSSGNDSTLHRKVATEMLDNYFKTVCQLYSDLRAIRARDIVEKKRLSRLQFVSKKKLNFEMKDTKEEEDDLKAPIALTSNKFNKFLYEDSDDEITAEDEANFQRENQQLLSNMNNMMDDVKAIEGKVVEIARLQDMFNEQVYQQEADINMVADTIIHSSENIRSGNESLREAMMNNATFRVWLLFFLVMCSFSLIFLEWYS